MIARQKAGINDPVQVRQRGEVEERLNAPGYNLLADTITISHPEGLYAVLSSLFGFLRLRHTIRMIGSKIAAIV